MTLTNHNLGQMQHAEYESQATRYPSAAPAIGNPKSGLIVGKIAAIVQQARNVIQERPSKQLATQS